MNQLPINTNDLEKVSAFLAPHYGISPEQKQSEILNMIHAYNLHYEDNDTENKRKCLSIECGGFIVIQTNKQVRIFLGNHLIGAKVLVISPLGKRYNENGKLVKK